MIRVLVADNRPLFHSAYYAAFAETVDITVIDTISDENQLWTYCQQEQPNVIFISQGMYNSLPPDFFIKPHAHCSSIYSLVLLASKSSFCLDRINESGISGCLLENDPVPQLI
jgi:DNA-binding NarL/FixJ family response regulator